LVGELAQVLYDGLTFVVLLLPSLKLVVGLVILQFTKKSFVFGLDVCHPLATHAIVQRLPDRRQCGGLVVAVHGFLGADAALRAVGADDAAGYGLRRRQNARHSLEELVVRSIDFLVTLFLHLEPLRLADDVGVLRGRAHDVAGLDFGQFLLVHLLLVLDLLFLQDFVGRS